MAIYFASDFHLGLDSKTTSKEREKLILSWLDFIKPDLEELYLLGDVFDYWFEYKYVVPKGYTRFLSKLSEITDLGIPVHIFTGNHDMWMFSYLEEEIGVQVYRKPMELTIKNKSYLIGHGDGLGPGDKKYKLLKKLISSKFNQWLFARLHPNFAIGLMKRLSQKSREKEPRIVPFRGSENEWLVQYAEKKSESKNYDFFIFGHRHLPLDYLLSNKKSRYLNTGDWISHNSYVKVTDNSTELLNYKVD